MDHSTPICCVKAEIDLDAAENNLEQIKKCIPNGKRLICVVKGNAYGHGAYQLSRLYAERGCELLAVSSLDEALELRRLGIDIPILVLGYTPPEHASTLAEKKLTQCVFSEDYAAALSSSAASVGARVDIHFKVDSGMGRLGFPLGEEGFAALERSIRLSGLKALGIFTHFSSADCGEDGRKYTGLQSDGFTELVGALAGLGCSFDFIHASNSAAILEYPGIVPVENAVRAGIVLYGYHPSGAVKNRLPIIPVMTLSCVIAHVKTVPRGSKIGYGGSFEAERDMSIATLPLGYADGIPRTDGLGVWDGERICPVVGRVCMDQMMIDVTGTNHKVGDTVTVFGRRPAPCAHAIADSAGMISYSLLCGISRRVPRLYVKDGKVVDRVNYLEL